MNVLYRMADNRILRVCVCLLMVLVMLVVPTENKLQEAKTAYAFALFDDAAVAIVIFILIGMGISITYKNLHANVVEGMPRYSRENLRTLAVDILSNCNVVACFAKNYKPFSNALLAVPAAVYTAIRQYFAEKYGEDNEDLQASLNGDSSLTAIPGMIKNGPYFIYPVSALTFENSNSVNRYPLNSLTFSNSSGNVFTFDYELSDYDVKTGRSTYTIHRYKDGASNGQGYVKNCLNFSDNVAIGYTSSGISQKGMEVYLIFYTDESKYNPLPSMGMTWFDDVGFVEAAESLSCGNGFVVDQTRFDDVASDSPYIKVSDVDDYDGLTYRDVVSSVPAADGYDSTIVNSSARTLTWTGDIPDCPIDDLKPYLAGLLGGAVIGNWTCQWQESGTMCDISVTDATTGETVGTASIDVGLTWTDVLEKTGVGTDAEAGTTEGTIAGTATGELTLPTDGKSIDLSPFKVAGDIFTTRFPFSLPWDLWYSFTYFFDDSREKSKIISIPIDFGELGQHEMIVDLSPIFEDNTVLIVRYGFFVMFLFGMIVLTNKLIGRG